MVSNEIMACWPISHDNPSGQLNAVHLDTFSGTRGRCHALLSVFMTHPVKDS